MEVRNVVDRSVVALATIIGLPGVDKFHCNVIENPWVRVQINEVFSGDVGLPIPNAEEKQLTLKNVVGLNILWNAKFLRKC